MQTTAPISFRRPLTRRRLQRLEQVEVLKGAGRIIHGPLNNHGTSTPQPAANCRAT